MGNGQNKTFRQNYWSLALSLCFHESQWMCLGNSSTWSTTLFLMIGKWCSFLVGNYLEHHKNIIVTAAAIVRSVLRDVAFSLATETETEYNKTNESKENTNRICVISIAVSSTDLLIQIWVKAFESVQIIQLSIWCIFQLFDTRNSTNREQRLACELYPFRIWKNQWTFGQILYNFILKVYELSAFNCLIIHTYRSRKNWLTWNVASACCHCWKYR